MLGAGAGGQIVPDFDAGWSSPPGISAEWGGFVGYPQCPVPQLAVGSPQLSGALDHLAFQGLLHLVQIIDGEFQTLAHPVKRIHQLIQFLTAARRGGGRMARRRARPPATAIFRDRRAAVPGGWRNPDAGTHGRPARGRLGHGARGHVPGGVIFGFSARSRSASACRRASSDRSPGRRPPPAHCPFFVPSRPG